MEKALRDFALPVRATRSSHATGVHARECASYHQIILGKENVPRPAALPLPDAFNVPGLLQPNASQIQAIKAAMSQAFTLIQGPPGGLRCIRFDASVPGLIFL